MEELQPPPLPKTDNERRPGMSLPARLLNIFAIPGQVFAELRTAPHAISNWLVPTILGSIVGVVSVLMILSQPAVQKQFQERQMQLLEQRSKSGKLTPQELSVAEQFTGPKMLKWFGGAGAVLGSVLSVFWWGFLIWFLARRPFRVPIPFSKALEVAGLSMMINVLGGFVAMLLIVNLGRTGGVPTLSLVVNDFEMTRKGYLFAAAANVFAFWVVAVRSVGLAKLTNAPFLRAAWLVVTCWVLEQCFFAISGLGQLAM